MKLTGGKLWRLEPARFRISLTDRSQEYYTSSFRVELDDALWIPIVVKTFDEDLELVMEESLELP